MRNLLALTAFLAALLLVTRRANQPIKVVAEFKLRGQDLVAIGRSERYRSKTD